MRTSAQMDRLVEEFQLDDVQTTYLRALDEHTTALTANQRVDFLESSAELLGERPRQSWDELTNSLSPPDSFAATWIAEHAIVQTKPSWTQRLRQPRTLGAIIAITGGLVAALWAFSYVTAEPHLANNCSGARGPAVEQLEAAGQTEYVMPLVLDARYGVVVCVSAWDDFNEEAGRSNPANATIDRIYLADPFFLAVQPVGWEIINFDSETQGDASQNESYQWAGDSGIPQTIVWFEGDRCNIEGGTGFSTLSVDYTYRGQQRTGTVDLLASYTFEAPSGQCTDEVRAAEEAADSRWRSVVNGRIENTGRIDTRSVQLEPESVSRDLCRYLRGIDTDIVFVDVLEIEPLESRAVFQLEPEVAIPLIDGAVLGICPEFAGERDALVGLAEQQLVR